MGENDEYARVLLHQAHTCIHHLETMFGQRRPGFLFRSIRQSGDEYPRIHFPFVNPVDGNRVVDIHIGKTPWERRDAGRSGWQVAHECVHLLDPGLFGTSNVLEEGLATWFQDNPTHHLPIIREYIVRHIGSNMEHPRNYADAKEFVRRCMPELIGAVSASRASGTRISDITTDELAQHLLGKDTNTIKRLCAGFQY